MNAKIRLLIVMISLVAVRAQSEQQQFCDLNVSVFERRDLTATAILNKLGFERSPNLPPMIPTPDQESDLMAVQGLQDLKRNDKVMCTKRDTTSTLKQATFSAKAKALSPHYETFDDNYSVYNYFNLFGKGRKKRVVKSSLPIPPDIYQFTFPINTTYSGRSLMSSELYLLRKVSSNGRGFLTNTETIQLVYLYKMWYLDGKGYPVRLIKRDIIATKVVNVVDEYMSFDTTEAVNKWMELNNKDTGMITFEVVIKPPVLLSTGLPLTPVIEFDVHNKSTSQFVLNFVRSDSIPDSSQSVRKKRVTGLPSIPRLDAKFCFSNPEESNCCIRNLTIDFAKDLGYTWVVAPKTYQPNYCTGLCPALWPTVSQSTSLLRLFRERNPTFAVTPCCSPEELEPLSVLINTEKGPLIQELPDMVIKSCICR